MPFIEANNKRVLFIHIPKTGGTSIEKALSSIAPLNLCARAIPKFMRVPPEHLTFSDIQTMFDHDYFDYVFTIVRNPYTRIESEYRMRCILERERFFRELPSFPIWLEQAFEAFRNNRYIFANHLRAQVEFLGSEVRVFKYENGLEPVVREVGKQLGVDLCLPDERLLATNAAKIQIGWTHESLRKVNKVYTEDFDLLNYEQNRPGIKFED